MDPRALPEDVVADILRGVPGINRVFADPDDQLGALPAALVAGASSRVERRSDADALWVHTITASVFVDDLNANIGARHLRARELRRPIERAFWAATRTPTLPIHVNRAHVREARVGALSFASRDYVGLTVTVEVKEHTP